MYNIKLALCFVFLAVCVQAQTPCFARITATARPGAAWSADNTEYQIYDISATNEGACTLTRIVGFFSAREGIIVDPWNYDPTSGLISNFGGRLAVGQTFNGAGFLLANSSGVTLAFDRPGCDDDCATPTPSVTITPDDSASSSNASGDASDASSGDASSGDASSGDASSGDASSGDASSGDVSSGDASSGDASSGDASSGDASSGDASSGDASSGDASDDVITTPTPSTGTCDVTSVITKDDYSWTDSEGRNTSVYHLTITNNGPCALMQYALSFAYYPGELLSYYNLQPTLGGYLVTGYGESLGAGASYNGATLIIADADGVVPTPYGSNCAC